MKEYIIWGFTNKEIREALDNGMPTRMRLCFNERGFSHVAVSLTDKEANEIEKIFERYNKEKNYNLKLFKMEEFDVYV